MRAISNFFSKFNSPNLSSLPNKSNNSSSDINYFKNFNKLPDVVASQVVEYLDDETLDNFIKTGKSAIPSGIKQYVWERLIARRFGMPLFEFYPIRIAALVINGGYSMRQLYYSLQFHKVSAKQVIAYIKLALTKKIEPKILSGGFSEDVYYLDNICCLIEKYHISYDESKSKVDVSKLIAGCVSIRIAANSMENLPTDYNELITIAKQLDESLIEYTGEQKDHILYLCHEKGLSLDEAKKYVDGYRKDSLDLTKLHNIYNIPPYYTYIKSPCDFLVTKTVCNAHIQLSIIAGDNDLFILKQLIKNSLNILEKEDFQRWLHIKFIRLGFNVISFNVKMDNPSYNEYNILLALKRLFPNEKLTNSYNDNKKSKNKLNIAEARFISLGVTRDEAKKNPPKELVGLQEWQYRAMQYLIAEDTKLEHDWHWALSQISGLNEFQASLLIKYNLTKLEISQIYTLMEAVILLSFKHLELTFKHVRKLANECNRLTDLHFGMLYHLLMVKKESISVAVEQLPEYLPRDMFDILNPQWQQLLIEADCASAENKE